MKKNFKKTGIGLIVSALAITGAYAVLKGSEVAQKQNALKAGNAQVIFEDGTNSITLSNNLAIPMTNEYAVANLTPYTFKVTNKGSVDMEYSLVAVTEDGTTINSSLVMLQLDNRTPITLAEANLMSGKKIAAGTSDDHSLIAYINENAVLENATDKVAKFHLELSAIQTDMSELPTITSSYSNLQKSQIATNISVGGESKNVEVYNIEGDSKTELLNKLQESGLANPSDVDALVEVKGEDYDGLNSTATFDVSSVANEGDTVVILHFNETTQEWEYIGEETVGVDGTVSGDFTSYSPVAFVVVKKENISLAGLLPYIDPNTNTFKIEHGSKRENIWNDSIYSSDWNLLSGNDVDLDNIENIRAYELDSNGDILASTYIQRNGNGELYAYSWNVNTYNENNQIIKTDNLTNDLLYSSILYSYDDNGELTEENYQSYRTWSDGGISNERIIRYDNDIAISLENLSYDDNNVLMGKNIQTNLAYDGDDKLLFKNQKSYSYNWETNELYLSSESVATNETLVFYSSSSPRFTEWTTYNYDNNGNYTDKTVQTVEVIDEQLKETTVRYDTNDTKVSTDINYTNYPTKAGIGNRSEQYDSNDVLISLSENVSSKNGNAQIQYKIQNGTIIGYIREESVYSPEYSQSRLAYNADDTLYNGLMYDYGSYYNYYENGEVVYILDKGPYSNGLYQKRDKNFNLIGWCDENGNLFSGLIITSEYDNELGHVKAADLYENGTKTEYYIQLVYDSETGAFKYANRYSSNDPSHGEPCDENGNLI